MTVSQGTCCKREQRNGMVPGTAKEEQERIFFLMDEKNKGKYIC